MEGNNTLQVAEISISYSPMVKSEDRVKIRSSSDAERVLRSVFPSGSRWACKVPADLAKPIMPFC
jgi:hypothetical protein